MKRFSIFIFAALLPCIVFSQSTGQPISPLLLGQAYWYTQWNNPKQSQIQIFESVSMFTTSPTSTTWPTIKGSGLKLMRAGGEGYNIGASKPIGNQEIYYVSIVDDIVRMDANL